jgi:hypothetical protein
MKITWVLHPTKPELNGTDDHVKAEVGVVAIGFGFAKKAENKDEEKHE